jgi:phenylalanyl-tRNA synthetase alpha chain
MIHPKQNQMTLQDYLNEAETIEREGATAMQSAVDSNTLEAARIAFLGDRQGRVKALQEALRGITKEDKPAAGKVFNDVRTRLEALHAERKSSLARNVVRTSEDLTLPGRGRWAGAKHPVTLVIEEIDAIFRELGFTIAQGPDAETEWYNFGALNFPPNHPALDAHDTLYLDGEGLLRTHTSPVQVRTLQSYAPPIRVLIPGNAYRRDFFDASHAPVFMQIEGLCVDEGVSFVDLKSTLNVFAQRFFGAARTRFRPSFFPFTEPSAEMDVQCGICAGAGCAACKGTGWIEILGSGMVHPSVLEAAGIDSERYTGWAFGMGPARMAISRYKIPDIRILYDSDVRFLEQISGAETGR